MASRVAKWTNEQVRTISYVLRGGHVDRRSAMLQARQGVIVGGRDAGESWSWHDRQDELGLSIQISVYQERDHQ